MNASTHTCERYDEQLLDHAYGELDAAARSALDAHLASCPRCQEALAAITSTRKVMQQLPAVPAPDAGLESLLAYAGRTAKRQQAEAARPSGGARWLRWLVPALPFGGLVVALLWVVARPPEPQKALETVAAVQVEESKSLRPQAVLSSEAAAAPIAQGVAMKDEADKAAEPPRAEPPKPAEPLALAKPAPRAAPSKGASAPAAKKAKAGDFEGATADDDFDLSLGAGGRGAGGGAAAMGEVEPAPRQPAAEAPAELSAAAPADKKVERKSAVRAEPQPAPAAPPPPASAGLKAPARDSGAAKLDAPAPVRAASPAPKTESADAPEAKKERVRAAEPEEERHLAATAPAAAGAAAPAPTGPLVATEIMDVVLAHRDPIRKCTDEHKARTGASGVISMRWSIQPDGRVKDVRTLTRELSGTPLAACLTKVIETFRYRAYTGGPMDPVTFPFKF